MKVFIPEKHKSNIQKFLPKEKSKNPSKYLPKTFHRKLLQHRCTSLLLGS
jgi:hypothetical protein